MDNSSSKPWADGPMVTCDLISHVCAARSIENREDFILPKWPDHLHDPLLLPDCKVAVDRMWQAIKNSEKIGIVGDYDMDGTPAATLLSGYLKFLGAKTEVILPTRADGYGFSPVFVDRLVDSGAKLIITVDCGIRDFSAVERAKERACDVIITDHHECAEDLPQALAVVNPKRGDSQYPFSELCGTGVIFKLLQAVNNAQENGRKAEGESWLMWSLDLVALATIGDMVPLVDENRVLTIYGMKVLRRGKRVGLRRLIEALTLNPAQLSYGDIAYKVVPKLNASGRLESMEDVFALLSVESVNEADILVKQILTRDTQRQLLSKSIYQQVKTQLIDEDSPVIIAYHESWHPGVTGIVAGQLAREYNRPAVVFGSLDGQLFRGSMRSVGGIHLPTLLHGVSDELVSFGGHAEAAGLSINQNKLLDFKTKLKSLANGSNQPISSVLTTDGLLDIGRLQFLEIEALESLAPWGMGHPEPYWSMNEVILEDVRWIGQDGTHLKASLRCANGMLDVIYFGASEWQGFDWQQPVDVYGILGINEFRGVKKPQLMLKGIHPKKELHA